ncbi:hypothetical protein OB13_06185 [Pontibacter sp. HJ8]
MKKGFLASILSVLCCLSCSANKELEVETLPTISAETPAVIQGASTKPVVEVRREYWPLDHDIYKEDTIIHVNEVYHISTNNYSLNDSAVVHEATDNLGKLLVHSHNRVADVTIHQNQQPFIKASLTKDIFEQNIELYLTGTEFLRYDNGAFIFMVDACIPDTDVSEAAEVSIDQTGKVRVVRFVVEEE